MSGIVCAQLQLAKEIRSFPISRERSTEGEMRDANTTRVSAISVYIFQPRVHMRTFLATILSCRLRVCTYLLPPLAAQTPTTTHIVPSALHPRYSCTSRRRQIALFDITTEMRISPGGSLEIITDVEPRKGVLRDSLSLARVGMQLKLPPGFGHVEWFGKGPFECYQDRKVRKAVGGGGILVEDLALRY